MKFLNYITLLLTTLLFIGNSFGQTSKSYLSIYEGINSVGDAEEVNKHLIVDINAILSIKLQLGELKKDHILNRSVSDTNYINKLKKLEDIIKLQKEALKSFNSKSKRRFDDIYDDLIDSLEQDYKDDLFNKFRNLTIEAHESKGRLNTYSYPLEHFLDDYNLERTQWPNKTGKKIALVAKLIPQDKRVHVTNFDNIKEEYWVSNNWDLSELPSELESGQINSLNQTINDTKQVLDGILKEQLQALDVSKLKQGLDLELKQLSGAKQSAMLSTVELVKTQLDGLNKEILKPYSSSTEFLLENKIDLVEQTLNQVQSLPGAIVKEIRDKLSLLDELNTKLIKPFQSTINKAEKSIRDFEGYSIEDVPEQAYIDLRGTGKREAGDNLLIELIIRTERPGAEPIKEVIQFVSIQLEQVKVYAIANVGAILANPYLPDPEYNLKSEFQLAPCTNIMFKKGSRNSKGWNFMQPGIGINISTPDFNTDGVPDFSFGIVGSVFKDLITTGISYNTAVDEPFWFIGFSLPLANLALPVGSIQSIANQ